MDALTQNAMSFLSGGIDPDCQQLASPIESSLRDINDSIFIGGRHLRSVFLFH